MGGKEPQKIQKSTSHLLALHRGTDLGRVSRLSIQRKKLDETHGTHPNVLGILYETHVDQKYTFEVLPNMAY